MKECPSECRLNGELVTNNILYGIEMSIEILRYSMEKMKRCTRKLCKQLIQSLNPQTSHTKTIKDLDDAYTAVTDELVAELDEATAE